MIIRSPSTNVNPKLRLVTIDSERPDCLEADGGLSATLGASPSGSRPPPWRALIEPKIDASPLPPGEECPPAPIRQPLGEGLGDSRHLFGSGCGCSICPTRRVRPSPPFAGYVPHACGPFCLEGEAISRFSYERLTAYRAGCRQSRSTGRW